jgi:Protein of unknown function (DUF4231)
MSIRETKEVSQTDLSPEDPLEFLIALIQRLTSEYKAKRDWNRRYAFFTRMLTVVIGATTTVIIGVGSSSLFTSSAVSQYTSLVALFLTASVTVISAWEAFSGHDWKWVRYRTTLADLYELTDDIKMRKLRETPLEADKVDEFYQRLEAILHDTNAEWTRRRSQPPTPVTTPQTHSPSSVAQPPRG